MEKRLEDIFGQLFLPKRRPFILEEKGEMLFIDVFENEGKYIVKTELTGMKEEDITVSVIGDTLSMKGKRKAESEVKEEGWQVV